jgi:hypothetical protein
MSLGLGLLYAGGLWHAQWLFGLDMARSPEKLYIIGNPGELWLTLNSNGYNSQLEQEESGKHTIHSLLQMELHSNILHQAQSVTNFLAYLLKKPSAKFKGTFS